MAESKTAVVAALLGNAALALLKAVAALATGSAAMLAETFHSIADTGNQTLLMLGMRLARRPPDHAHPFGHGKNVYFWAFVVSMMLFSLGGAFAIWEAVRRFLHPVQHEAGLLWAWGVLGGAFVFESISLAVAVRSLREAKGERTVLEYFGEARDPTLATVVLEDSAALTSILVAGAGLGLSRVTGNAMWDGAASAVIGVVLIAVALLLAFESYSMLLGERASARVEARIRRAVQAHPAVRNIEALDTMHMGPDVVLVALRVILREGVAGDRPAVVLEIEDGVREALGGLTRREVILVEPVPASASGRRAA